MVNFELNLVQFTLYELDLNLDHFLALITDTKHLLRTNTVTNVHVSNKLTIGIYSIVSNPLTRVGKSESSIRLG